MHPSIFKKILVSPLLPLPLPSTDGTRRIQWGLFTSREEEESDDGFEHALVFFYGGSVSATFLADHSPCLEVRDGVLDSGPDFA